MPKFKLKAKVGWIAGSDTEFGVYEFASQEEAFEAAFEAACEQLDAYAEEVGDDDD